MCYSALFETDLYQIFWSFVPFIILQKAKLQIDLRVSKLLKETPIQKENEIKIFENSNNSKNEILESTKILFSFDWQSEAFSTKILEEPKVYLNIIYADDFTGPLDDNNQVLKYPENDKDWRYIPTEFKYNNKKMSMSGKRCDFYDMIVNTKIIEAISKNEELKRSILAYFVRKFVIFLNNKYELFQKNVKILKTKKYKSIKGLPEDFIFKPNSKNNNNNQIDNNPNSANINHDNNIKNSFVPAKNFFDIPENKINIPNQSENFTNTPTFYNMPKNSNDKNKNKNNLMQNKNINKKEENTTTSQPKKILIEDITKKTKRIIEIKKTILDSNQMEVKFHLENFEEVESINDIDLQVSENGIKLFLEKVPQDEYDPVDMNFNFEVNPDNCIAKYDKINKILKLILSKA